MTQYQYVIAKTIGKIPCKCVQGVKVRNFKLI